MADVNALVVTLERGTVELPGYHDDVDVSDVGGPIGRQLAERMLRVEHSRHSLLRRERHRRRGNPQLDVHLGGPRCRQPLDLLPTWHVLPSALGCLTKHRDVFPLR